MRNESNILRELNSIFHLDKDTVPKEISVAFYNAFNSFFVDKTKFQRYLEAVKGLFTKISGEGKVILDAGCGFGLVSIIFSCLGAKEVIAIDFSEKEISGFTRILAKLPPINNLKIYRMDATKTEFRDNYFDIIFSSDIISHVYDLEKFILEAKRILKGKGIFYIYESNSVFSISRRLFLKRYWRMVEYGPVNPQIGLEKPFNQLRRDIITESFPGLESGTVDFLIKSTQGMIKEQIVNSVRQFLNEGKIAKKKGFKYADPRTGMLAELPINPFLLKKQLEKFGFKSEIIPPYFYYTYPYLSHPLNNNKMTDIFKAYIKRIIRYFYPLSLLMSPTLELIAQKNEE